MLIKYAKTLPRAERRLYQVLGVNCFIIWIGGIIMAFFIGDNTLPWEWIGMAGGMGAMVFGFAVSNTLRIWPFYLFFKDGDQGK